MFILLRTCFRACLQLIWCLRFVFRLSGRFDSCIQDQELVVRQHLGEQLEEIARFCRLQGKEAGYRLIIEVRRGAERCGTQNTSRQPCMLRKERKDEATLM